MMKKTLLLGMGIFLTACARPSIVEIPVSRLQIYYGQSVENLYENFGIPKRITRYAYDVIEYTFVMENMSIESVGKRLLYCNLWVYARDNRVIDWKSEGNNCHYQEMKVTRYLDERRDEKPSQLTFDDD